MMYSLSSLQRHDQRGEGPSRRQRDLSRTAGVWSFKRERRRREQPTPREGSYHSKLPQHSLTKLREESTTEDWRTDTFFPPGATKREAHEVLRQKFSDEARAVGALHAPWEKSG